MKPILGWTMILLTILSLAAAACAPEPALSEKEVPVHLTEIEGSDFKRIELTNKAAERLGIETTAVLEEAVTRQRMVGGEVITINPDTTNSSPVPTPSASTADTVYVKVNLNQSDISRVDHKQTVSITPLDLDGPGDQNDEIEGTEVEDVDGLGEEINGEDEVQGALYYAVKIADQKSLTLGQRVRVMMALEGSGQLRKVIPYAAVIYGLKGETWVYTNPESHVYIRQAVVIDFIEGDLAVLTEGPEIGTQVVTAGSSELFGAESGVGGGH